METIKHKKVIGGFLLVGVFLLAACSDNERVGERASDDAKGIDTVYTYGWLDTNYYEIVARSPGDSIIKVRDRGLTVYIKTAFPGDSNKLHWEGLILKGKEQGKWIYYSHIKGAGVSAIENYKNGVRHGEDIRFYPNGKIESKETYVDGKVEGYRREFQQDGTLRCKLRYAGGRKQGESWYYNEGNLDSTKPNSMIWYKNDTATRVLNPTWE